MERVHSEGRRVSGGRGTNSPQAEPTEGIRELEDPSGDLQIFRRILDRCQETIPKDILPASTEARVCCPEGVACQATSLCPYLHPISKSTLERSTLGRHELPTGKYGRSSTYAFPNSKGIMGKCIHNGGRPPGQN